MSNCPHCINGVQPKEETNPNATRWFCDACEGTGFDAVHETKSISKVFKLLKGGKNVIFKNVLYKIESVGSKTLRIFGYPTRSHRNAGDYYQEGRTHEFYCAKLNLEGAKEIHEYYSKEE